MTDSEKEKLLQRFQGGISGRLIQLAGGVPPEEAVKLEQASQEMARNHVGKIEEIRKKSKEPQA